MSFNTLRLAGALIAFCGFSSVEADDDTQLFLVPWPKMVQVQDGELSLGPQSRIVASDERLAPLAGILADEIWLASGLRLAPGDGPARDGDISLDLTVQREGDEGLLSYSLRIGDRAAVSGGSYQAVAQGTTTLVQALRVAEGRARLPRLEIDDGPRFPYCGAMLDVARKPFPIDTLRQCVDVCRFYKIRYLHLHMSDENAWTFPSRTFPQLGSQNFAWAGGEAPTVYPLEELTSLVAYADARGVTLVPELEVPGHSGQLRGTLPDIFGYRGADGKPVALGVVNMASQKAVDALDAIIGEMSQVFHSSPYIHLGCDEASLGGIEEMPEVTEFVREHKLAHSHDIFNDFVYRLHAVVRKHGKRLIVWEGAPVGPRPLPEDVVFMPWVGHSAAAADLVEQGYTVINAPWGVEQPYFDPYRVNAATLRRGEPLLLGATSILWESPADKAVPHLRSTGALRNEPVYHPDSGRDYADFLRRVPATDLRLDRLLCGFGFRAEGALPATVHQTLAPLFADSVTLSLDSAAPAEQVHYTLDGSEPGVASAVYSGPIELKQTALLKARWIADDGAALGAPFVREYRRLPTVSHDGVGAAVAISPARPGYFGPGPRGLTDGFQAAGDDFHFSGWVGWAAGERLSITLDLGRPTELRRVGPHCLRSAGGVALPQQVELAVSDDGREFRGVATVGLDAGARNRGWFLADLRDVTARYLRVSPAAGGDWTFIDEVAVNPAPAAPDVEHAAVGKTATTAFPPTAYTMPGIEGLTNGCLCREANFLSPDWLGFEWNKLDATIDLGEPTHVARVGAHFLQDVRAGVFVPGKVEVFVSDDGDLFHPVATIQRAGDADAAYVKTLSADLDDVRARYVRIVAHPSGQWLFVDELFVHSPFVNSN